METLLNEMFAMSSLELIAAVLALSYVWLAARQNIWCWLSALGSSSIYTYIFWQVALPFQSALNFYYVLMAVYGWWNWRHMQSDQLTPVIKHFSAGWHLVAIIALVGISLLMSVYVGQSTQPVYLGYLDAGVAVFSVFTTFLVTQKVLENWVYWFFINVAACYLYASQELYFTTALFVVYVAMSAYGFYAWKVSEIKNNNNMQGSHFAP